MALLPQVAAAQWTGRGEAGLVIARGNTETETANAKLAVVLDRDRWKYSAGATELYASDVDGKTAQRFEVRGQSDYNFRPRAFWFGSARYEEDDFSGFEYQATLATGLGRRFIDTKVTKFAGTVGAGYKFFESRAVLDPTGVLLTPAQSDREPVFFGTLDFEHRFNEVTSVTDKFIVEAGSTNTFVQNDLVLQVKMTSVLALAVGLSARINTDPPAGFQESDTVTTVNLVYEIK